MSTENRPWTYEDPRDAEGFVEIGQMGGEFKTQEMSAEATYVVSYSVEPGPEGDVIALRWRVVDAGGDGNELLASRMLADQMRLCRPVYVNVIHEQQEYAAMMTHSRRLPG